MPAGTAFTASVAVQSMLFRLTLRRRRPSWRWSPGSAAARAGRLPSRGVRQGDAGGEGGAAGIRHGEPTQLLRRMLEDWAADGVPSEEEMQARLDALLGAIACHSWSRR